MSAAVAHPLETCNSFLDLLLEFSSDYNLCCGHFNIQFNKICPASTDFKVFLDEFGLVQSVQLPTHKSGNTLDLVLGPRRFGSHSDHKWPNFYCLKFFLENRENIAVNFRNWENDNLVVFNEHSYYQLWFVVGSHLVDSFLEPQPTISDQYAPEMERVVSKHDCLFTTMN